jgi:aminopeptidase N
VQNPCHGITFSQDNALVCCEFEPCAARYAIPCQDWPYFACSFEFHLRAAREATRLATGALIAETDHNDGSVTSIWRQEKPIAPYSASFIVGTMTRAGESYFGKASVDVETLQRTFRSEPEIRGWLESKLGPFPSEKVYHVLLDCYTALENESLIIVRLFFFLSLFL